jgi:cytoskeletal protein CcmA (bactofilin family)
MFSKKPQNKPVNPSRSPVVNRVAGSTFSVFGADTTIKGDVHASADLHIDGRIEGDVACTSLVQGESSEVVGAINANAARLSGTVRGSISVGELVILKSARIFGDVHYDALTIEQGAQVDGRFAHRDAGSAPLAVGEDGEPRLTLAG